MQCWINKIILEWYDRRDILITDLFNSDLVPRYLVVGIYINIIEKMKIKPQVTKIWWMQVFGNRVMYSYFNFCLPDSAACPWTDSLYTNCARMEKSFGTLCFSKIVIHWKNPLSIITLGCKPVMLRKNLIKYHNNCISPYQYLPSYW